MVEYEWRGRFGSNEVETLHAEGFEREPEWTWDWRQQVERHSLGWVCARDDASQLVGWVNVAWDGGVHAFLLDTIVASTSRRQGIATRLVEHATKGARAGGCEWLHVDFDEWLRAFYLTSCAFTSTNAGLIQL
ncbi:MAG: GNAT family N-acetyltransferase [Actinomycetia bacterium]|nr:GNAT family N-acetyltransferase [Actinomycetes bacterium]